MTFGTAFIAHASFIVYARLEGAAALESTLRELPVHEEQRQQLASVLQQAENETRSQIAEAARTAAELRY